MKKKGKKKIPTSLVMLKTVAEKTHNTKTHNIN